MDKIDVNLAGLDHYAMRLQSAFPKVHFSEGSLFRRFIVPKVHCSEKKVYCAEGLLVRRVIYPK